MSGEHRDVSFGIVTTDYERWTDEQRAAAEAENGLYADYPTRLVAEAMHAAGQAVIDAHPEMFACELI